MATHDMTAPLRIATLALLTVGAVGACGSSGDDTSDYSTFGNKITTDAFDQALWSSDNRFVVYVRGSTHAMNTQPPAVMRLDLGTGSTTTLDEGRGSYSYLAGDLSGPPAVFAVADDGAGKRTLLEISTDGTSPTQPVADDVASVVVGDVGQTLVYAIPSGVVVHDLRPDPSPHMMWPVTCAPIAMSGTSVLCSNGKRAGPAPTTPPRDGDGPAILDVTTGAVTPVALQGTPDLEDPRSHVAWDYLGLRALWTDLASKTVIVSDLIGGGTQTVATTHGNWGLEAGAVFGTGTPGGSVFYWLDQCVSGGTLLSCDQVTFELHRAFYPGGGDELLARGPTYGTLLPSTDGQRLLVSANGGTTMRPAFP